MSLFGNLFSGGGTSTGGGLFSDTSAFRAGTVPATAPAPQREAPQPAPSKQSQRILAAGKDQGKQKKQKKAATATDALARSEQDDAAEPGPAAEANEGKKKAKDKRRAKADDAEAAPAVTLGRSRHAKGLGTSKPSETNAKAASKGNKADTRKPATGASQQQASARARGHQEQPAMPKRRASQADETDSDTASDDEAGPSDTNARTQKPKLTEEQQAERLRRTVWVGNLPSDATRKALKTLFARVGKVESTRLRSVPLTREAKLPRRAAVMQGKTDTARAPPIAYVVFESEESVQPALEFNMTEMGGHHIQVDRAARPSRQASQPNEAAASLPSPTATSAAVEYDPQRTLFCGNCHFHLTNEELIQFFTNGAALDGNPELAPAANGGKLAVEACRIVRDPATNIGKGFAFVLFRTKAAARAALSLNGREVHGRAVRLTRVSVQQQKKLHQLRTAAVAAGKPRDRTQGGGAAPKRKGPAGRRQGPSLHAPDPDSWQGQKTKGKGKDLRGPKAKDTAVRGRNDKTPLVGAKRAGGKRPAVAARKAASKADAKQGKGHVPRPIGVKKPHRKRQ